MFHVMSRFTVQAISFALWSVAVVTVGLLLQKVIIGWIKLVIAALTAV